jgi:hypothetical protein
VELLKRPALGTVVDGEPRPVDLHGPSPVGTATFEVSQHLEVSLGPQEVTAGEDVGPDGGRQLS